jgi:transposase
MNQELTHEIVRRYHEGQSTRGIARDLQISRERVRRTLAGHHQARNGDAPASSLPPPKQKRKSLLDDHEDVMRQLLGRYPRMTAVRMLEELRARGFQGGYSILKERMAQLRPQPAQPLVERFETGPGLQAQMDYAQYDLDFTLEGRRRVYLFSYLLAYSRRQYLCFTESQDFATTVRQHVKAFEHLGGVAAVCLYDNMKVVVSRYEADLPVYNTRFLAFATHYGYRPKACRPRHPATKGKVERPFHYVEMNLLNGREFHSLEHLNEVTRRWLAEVADVRLHRQTQRRPVDLHAEEQPHLIPLPNHPYDAAEVVYRSVDCEGYVKYRQNQYSVPWRYVGQVLPVRITEEELIVFSSQIEEIARHRLLPRSASRQCQLDTAHRPPDDRRQQYELLRGSFAEFGEVGERFFEGLLKAHRQGKAQARNILALRAHYHDRDLVQALERALRYGAFSFYAVERILHVQAQPKTALEMLADREKDHLADLLRDASVPPRPTGDYQQLLSNEEPHAQEEADPAKADHANPGDEEREPGPPPSGPPGELPNSEDSPDGPAA